MSNGHTWPPTTVGAVIRFTPKAKPFAKVTASNNDKVVQRVDVAVAKLAGHIYTRNAVVAEDGTFSRHTRVHPGGKARPAFGEYVGTAVTAAGRTSHWLQGIIEASGMTLFDRDFDYLLQGTGWPTFAEDPNRIDLNIEDDWGGERRWVPGDDRELFAQFVDEATSNNRPDFLSQAQARLALRTLWGTPGLVRSWAANGDSGAWVNVGTEVLCLYHSSSILWAFSVRRPAEPEGIAFPPPHPNAIASPNGLFWVVGVRRVGFCYPIQTQIDEINRLLLATQGPDASQLEFCTSEYPMAIRYRLMQHEAVPPLVRVFKGDGEQTVGWLKARIAQLHGVDPDRFIISRVDTPPHHNVPLNVAALLRQALPVPPYEVVMSQPPPPPLTAYGSF